MNEKRKHTTKEQRLELWVDLVRDVAKKHLPVSTKSTFIKLCLEAFEKNGYDDEYENPFFVSETFAAPRWKVIINEAACGNDGVFVKYVRERNGGGFVGQWKKVNKFAYIKEMEREAKGLETRVENYTYNVETAQKRWKNLQLPGFEVKQLASG